MSFWGIFGSGGSGGSSDELPSAGSSAPPSPSRKQQVGPPPTSAAPPTITAAGPPPTANAYLHTPLHSPVQQPRATILTPPSAAAAVPTFQIFTPKSVEAKSDAATNEETAGHEGAATDPPAQQYTEPIIARETEQKEQRSAGESAYYQMGPTATAALHAADDEKQPVIPASPEESDEDGSYEDDDDEGDDSDEEEDEAEWEWKGEDEGEVTDEEEREAVPANRQAQSTRPNYYEEEELITSTTSQKNQVGDTSNDHADLALRRLNSASPATLTKVVSPTKPSRFRFLQDESIPIPKLEEASTKRRHEFRSRMYEMDCHLAGIESLCADEGLDRDAGHRQVFPNVCLQLEGISDRYLGNKLMMDEDKTRILTLQRRVSQIHGKLVQYKHDTTNACMEDELESIGLDLLQSVQPIMQMEASKADKRESTLFRKFDSLAGTVARRFQEESATRKATMALLEEQMAVNTMEQQYHFLEHLRKLRTGLREEREARKERDAKVLNDVHATCSALMRAVLEAAGETNEQ